MAAGHSAPTPAASSAAGAPLDLTFEFWNDRSYQSFLPDDLRVLVAKFREQPRPTEVRLGGGRYTVRNFEQVEEGRSVQVNERTKFERVVRIRPPYHLPGAQSASLPAGPFHFQFEDDRSTWRAYSPWLQKELEQAVRCAPPPAQFFFVEDHKAYFLLGLDSLARTAGGGDLMQVNAKSGHGRRVRLVQGPASAPVQAGVPPPMQPAQGRGGGLLSRVLGSAGGGAASSSAGSRRGGGHHGGPPGNAAAAAASSNGFLSNITFDAPAPFSLGSAVFRLSTTARMSCGGPDKVQQLPPDAHEALCNAWRADPRPEQVTLPSGDIVVGFQDLEVGGTSITHTSSAGASHHLGPFTISGFRPHSRTNGSPTPLELVLPMPQPGTVVLPDSLDIETSESPLAFGRFLSNAEIAALPSRGAEAAKCTICLCDMEPEGDDLDADITMAPVDNSAGSNAVLGPVFELSCGHIFHTNCILEWFKQKRRCPQCQKDFGKVVGEQPRTATLQWHCEPFALPGHSNTRETIVIQFEFPSGTTPSGERYEGRKPKGYLPGNAQGILLLELFKIAFRRCVMFGIGNSMSFGTFRPTFNIHIKTSTHRGIAGHGYPDDTYFKRAMQELKDNGVTIADLPR